MNERLEDRLHDLVAGLDAPATPAARQRVGRRAATLSRRRRARTAVGGGVVAAALVLGGLSVARLGSTDSDGPETGPVSPNGEGSLPALTVEGSGWETRAAEDLTDQVLGDEVDPAYDPQWDGSLQVFRRPGSIVDPAAFLFHEVASDASYDMPLSEGGMGDVEEDEVRIGAATGFLSRPASGGTWLRWNPGLGDSGVSLVAWGLTDDEVLALARGLEPKQEGFISNPPEPGTVFGFVATELPAGLEEVVVDPGAAEPQRRDVRRVELARDQVEVVVQVDDRGERAFETLLAESIRADAPLEQVEVLGRPAVLAHEEGGDEDWWQLRWRPTDRTVATLTVTSPDPVDRVTVDGIIGGLTEVPEDEWRDVVAAGG